MTSTCIPIDTASSRIAREHLSLLVTTLPSVHVMGTPQAFNKKLLKDELTIVMTVSIIRLE